MGSTQPPGLECFHCRSVGVEARVPFLDHQIVEWCFDQPCSTHVDDAARLGKSRLREAARNWLPPMLVDRPKQVFPHPDPTAVATEVHRLANLHEADIRADPVVAATFSLPSHRRLATLPANTLWPVLSLWRWHHRLQATPRLRLSEPEPVTRAW